MRLIDLRCLSLLAGCALIVGCSGADKGNRLPTKPITVTVNYQGSPAAGATVSFIDTEGKHPAFGLTDEQGKARMKTYEEGDGAVFGSYKVTVSKMSVNTAPAADQDTPEYVPPEQVDVESTVEILLPTKYSLPGSSGFTAEVSEGGPGEFTFDLTD